jgi:hypothetical protein
MWHALDGQLELVPFRLDSACAGLVFAKPQETADQEAELSRLSQLVNQRLICSGHHT